MRRTGDCYECGDGIIFVWGGWQHHEELGIDVDGKPVVSECTWGKPYARGGDR